MITNKLNGPIFLKESSNLKEQLYQLNSLSEKLTGEVKKKLDLDMKFLSFGMAGEDTVAFELKNSFMPMIVLHDLSLEHEGLSAQIDYLVVTKKIVFILECKNLFGNIEINSHGDFIRSLEFNGKVKREGIYSPITQSQRHMELLRKKRKDNESNIIMKKFFDIFFNENFKSVVVLANPKTIVNMKYAKKEIRNQIIRSDQLIDYLKKAIKESKNESSTDKKMWEIAESLLRYHVEKTSDYSQKYQQIITPQEADTPEKPDFYKLLKEFRLLKSKEEGIKPYYIYSNAQMENLIITMPKTMNELMEIPGFGKVKCTKYGHDILALLNPCGQI